MAQSDHKTPPPGTTDSPHESAFDFSQRRSILKESEPTIMPDQKYFEEEKMLLDSVNKAALSLFSSASSPEEVAALRDTLLDKIAEGAAEARERIAAQEGK